jgi:hypothetical protein
MNRLKFPLELAAIPALEVLDEMPRRHAWQQIVLQARDIAGCRDLEIGTQRREALAQGRDRRPPAERPNSIAKRRGDWSR